MKQAVIINGPKGIFDLRFFFLLIKDGVAKINPSTADIKRTKGIACQPNNKPIPVINLASPKPIPSIFFITR